MIKNITQSALSETSGLLLREQIEKELTEIADDEVVVLDFTDIQLFSSSFFNVTIGYLIKNYGKEFVDKRIEIKNISDLGQRTYERSYNNAVKQSENVAESVIGEITQKSIEES